MSESAERAGRHTWKEDNTERDAARELGASSKFFRKTKTMKTSLETGITSSSGKCHVSTSQGHSRAQSAVRDSTQKAGGRPYALDLQTMFLEAEGQQLLHSHQDHIARGYHSICHYGVVHIPIPIPKGNEVASSKSFGDQRVCQAHTLPAWNESIVRVTADVFRAAQNTKRLQYISQR